MKQINMKLQLLIGGFVVVFALIYRWIFNNEMQTVYNIYVFVLYVLLGLCVIATTFITSKHKKKPFVLYAAYILALALALFI